MHVTWKTSKLFFKAVSHKFLDTWSKTCSNDITHSTEDLFGVAVGSAEFQTCNYVIR